MRIQLNLLELEPIDTSVPLTIGYKPKTLTWEESLDALIAFGEELKKRSP